MVPFARHVSERVTETRSGSVRNRIASWIGGPAALRWRFGRIQPALNQLASPHLNSRRNDLFVPIVRFRPLTSEQMIPTYKYFLEMLLGRSFKG